MSNNYGFEPTLDGLNNIDADSTIATDIICNNITINVSGTAPTMPALDNSTHLATTAYVNSHTSATYVTIGNPPQTITGEKTFSNANTFISGLIKDSSASTNSIELDDGSASHYLNLTSDHMTLSSSDNMLLSTGAYFVASGPNNFYFRNPSSFGNNLIIDDNNGASGALTLKIDSSIPFANISSSYQLDLNPDPIESLNLGTGLTTGSVNISTGTTVNAPITIGSITSTTQTATHNAISTFAKIPSCAVAPTSGNHLCNYTYVNSVIGPAILSLNNFWTGYNNFNLDVSMNSKLFVVGDVSMNSKLFVSGDVSMNSMLFVGGDVSLNSFKSSSTSTTLNPTTTITNQIGGVSKMTINTTTTTIDNTGFLQNQIGGVNKVYISNTNITTNPTTTLDLQVNSTSMLEITTTDLNVNASAGFTFIPTGTINTSVVSTVPAGFLYCNGQAVFKSTYAKLWTAIGSTFGNGNGTTTFNVPNFTATFLRGAGSKTVVLDTYTAAAVGTLQIDMALTTPKSGYSTPLESTGFRSCAGGARDCLARTNQGDPPENPTGLDLAYPAGRGGTEVRPLNMSVYYYIKY